MMAGMIGNYLTTEETAKRLDVSVRQVQNLITDGKLKAERVGREWLIPLDEVERYQRERKPAGRPSTKK
jgi:excisionase family DNA binding protein